jgi:hypothetical protein
MHTRYLALIADRPDDDQGRSDQVGMSSSNLADPWIRTRSRHLLLDRRGDGLEWRSLAGSVVIIGSIFSGLAGHRLTALSDTVARNAIGSGGISLLHEHWGRYVAIVTDDLNGVVSIVREPSMGMPCYFTISGHQAVIGSDLAVLMGGAA